MSTVVTEGIEDKVVSIVRKYSKADLDAGSIKPETTLLDDLQINSARLVDIIIDFETEFDITIEDEQVDKVSTVGEAVELIKSMVTD